MTRGVIVVLIAGAVWLGGSSPGIAQSEATAPGVEDNGRYSFHRVEDGFIRLDSRTGRLSQCSGNVIGWFCKTMPDDRTAFESEIGRLQQQNAELKKSLLARGRKPPAGATGESPTAEAPDTADKNTQAQRAPSEADFDRAFAYMKNAWRRLVEMMVELQRDIQCK